MNNFLVGVIAVVGIIVLWLGLVIVTTLLIAFPFEWSWNFAVVPAFRLPLITYWQAFGLCLILMLVALAFHKNSKK